MIDLARLPCPELEAIARAGRVVIDCARRLARQDDNAVAPLLRGQGAFYEWNHYPAGDVYDPGTHAQYYYHAHPPSEIAAPRRRGVEHGHFHTFLRPRGMPDGVAPAPLADLVPPAGGSRGDPGGDNEALSHLVAVAVDPAGEPVRLFTTNRWVTGETWYAAADVAAMLPGFAMRHDRPSAATNRWLTALIRLYRPDILALLRARDRKIAAWTRRHALAGAAAYNDRRLEITSEAAISVPMRLGELERVLGAGATSSPGARKR
jgi:hypothetical protein